MAERRVAVVGLGYFSQFHLAAWAAQPGAVLTDVCDLDAARAADAAARYGAQAHESLDTVLAGEPDILDVVVPPAAQDAVIRQALAPGRTIICQKPFCTSLPQAEALTDAAEAAGTKLVIHENFRFQPWYRRIRELLEAEELGALYQARFALRPGDGRGPAAYLDRQPGFQAMPRFLILETGVHFIDVFRWLFGEIDSVYADLRQLNPAIAGEDAGLLLLTHGSGMRSLFDGNRLADHVAENPRRTMGEMEIEAEAGSLRLDGAGRLGLRRFGAQAFEPVHLNRPVDSESFGGGCVAALIAHVVAALDGQAPFENEARDYLPVMRAVDAAYRSAAKARAIALRPGGRGEPPPG
mgnify:CR=1 FL=1